MRRQDGTGGERGAAGRRGRSGSECGGGVRRLDESGGGGVQAGVVNVSGLLDGLDGLELTTVSEGLAGRSEVLASGRSERALSSERKILRRWSVLQRSACRRC